VILDLFKVYKSLREKYGECRLVLRAGAAACVKMAGFGRGSNHFYLIYVM
jgi:hypothetical protein